MEKNYRYLDVEKAEDIFHVHLKQTRLEETEIEALGNELISLVTVDGCRKLIFDLGNNSPSVLFSLFLAKLVLVHRKLLEANGAMRLCAVKPHIMEVFQACRLENYFEFAPDRQSALAELNAGA
jgi:anti-sigma B factor antagonist